MPARVVVVGGGFGGISAVRALHGCPVDVTLLDRHNYHVFQPLLYQVATAGLSPGDIASPIRWILRRQPEVRVLLADVRDVDVARKVVRLDSGEVAYDYLILATGAAHAYFGHDNWEAHAPGLKTLDDALLMRRRVLIAFEEAERVADPEARRRLLTFAIVGGGPTGVELAGAVAEMARHTLAHEYRSFDPASARVVLLEAAPRILAMYPDSLQLAAARSLKRLGVDLLTSMPVTEVGPWGVTAGGRRIEAGTVLWAAGIAASGVARSLGVALDRAGRVLVQPDLSVPGHPDVFVIGDLASFQQDGNLLPGVAQVAVQMGRHAARGICRSLAGQPRVAFRYRDYGNMATIGRAAAIADFGWLRLSGWPAWVAWLFLHIMKLVGFRNRLGVLLQWAWAFVTYQRSVRLIIGRDDHRSS
jgi:NADH:ubiquinone reductase (H+-translocating)